jgi:hypothetical protein
LPVAAFVVRKHHAGVPLLASICDLDTSRPDVEERLAALIEANVTDLNQGSCAEPLRTENLRSRSWTI